MRTNHSLELIFTKEVDNVVHIGCSKFAAWMWQLPTRCPRCGSRCEDLCGFCVLQPCETSSHQQCLKYEASALEQNFRKNIFTYILAILVSKPGTGVILPAHIEVWKTPLKPRHGIPHDVFPVTEPSGKNDLSPVIDGTGITRKER